MSPGERAAGMPSECCSHTCVRRGFFGGGGFFFGFFFALQLPAWASPRVPPAPAGAWLSGWGGRRAASPAPALRSPALTPRPRHLPGRSLLTVVFSSWSQSPESLCRFHGNSLAGGNRFWGVEGAGSRTGTALGRACALALGLAAGPERAPVLHRPLHLPCPFPFLPAPGKRRGISLAVAREPGMSPGGPRAQLLGELLREGDSLEGSRKEQVFLTAL